MNLNKGLQSLREEANILPEEDKLADTLQKAKELYFSRQQDRLLTYWEFLWGQWQYTRKRWWALQAALLVIACQIVPAIEEGQYRVRTIGIIGCLFVVFMIPELWRNRESDSIQVEAACLYSLRQIYAARMTLFGIVDIMLLTLFGFSLGKMGFTMTEVTAHFLLPVTVTACICFSFLCGGRNYRETVSLFACLIWSGIWWLVVMNEWIYLRIAPAVWTGILGAAVLFLAWTIRRSLRSVNQYWEVEFL